MIFNLILLLKISYTPFIIMRKYVIFVAKRICRCVRNLVNLSVEAIKNEKQIYIPIV